MLPCSICFLKIPAHHKPTHRARGWLEIATGTHHRPTHRARGWLEIPHRHPKCVLPAPPPPAIQSLRIILSRILLSIFVIGNLSFS